MRKQDKIAYDKYCEEMFSKLPSHHQGECEYILILDEEHCKKCIEHSGKTLRQVHEEIMGRHINN